MKKRVLLEDEVSDWLQIWTAASSLHIKGNKAIKKKFVFLANRLVFQIHIFCNPNAVIPRHGGQDVGGLPRSIYG